MVGSEALAPSRDATNVRRLGMAVRAGEASNLGCRPQGVQ
jgi:hypothetical protein